MKAHIHAPRRPEMSGFTLVEVIVVLGVILMLAGIAVPMISSYVDDGKRARAEAEVKMLGAALTSVYKDVGVFATRGRNGSNGTLYALFSGPTMPTSNPFAANHSFSNWARHATRGDLMDHHLLENAPGGQTSAAYDTSGSTQWRGPYVAGSTPLDPWGRPYVASVIGSWYSHATRYKRMYVLSAGPNGRIDTDRDSTATTEIAGDDIGMILSQQK
ncbi:MAG: type II secretion system protein GspG [Planctomycetes bacterium]|nr:type II secretion system protein GspG [Planctomycetota bacterium]